MTTVFMQPLDVLLLRGNKLFGDAGSFGEALVPPWPSVVAGALRSRMLTDARLDWNPARNKQSVPRHPTLGTPDKPGGFSVTAFHLAHRYEDGRTELLVAPPADIVLCEEGEGGAKLVRRLQPQRSFEGLQSSGELPFVPLLAENKRSKPVGGYWLTHEGWRAYLAGGTPSREQFVKTELLWKKDLRVGVGLDAETRAAAEGQLFTVEALAMVKRGDPLGSKRADYNVGFVAEVSCRELPTAGLVRLGGDGRAAALHPAAIDWPQADVDAIVQSRRCRLVLTSPGLFEHGWLPTGADPTNKREDGAIRFDLHGVKGSIVCAAVPRFEVVSGWDLAKWQPKPALRAAPTGSVYWLELEQKVRADALRKLVERGLWTDEQYDSDMRRAEGFNRFTFAAY
jgi:CRISPR-associated protein Cmr3